MEDLGHQHDEFHDVMVLQHRCAKVRGHGGKIYIVDDREVMERRLRNDLSSTRRGR
jgi:hypothetical protein